jgi:hypothetical protein
MIAAACGENDIHRLKKEHLRALNAEIAKIAGIQALTD